MGGYEIIQNSSLLNGSQIGLKKDSNRIVTVAVSLVMICGYVCKLCGRQWDNAN